MLTSYNGNTLTYDALGNLTSYNGYTYTWEAGLRLAQITNGENTYNYKYDDNGIRTQKTVNGVTTHYTTVDGRITAQYDGTNTIYFRYNAGNSLIGFNLNGAEYTCLKNVQGDIEGILDQNGTPIVQYTYDAWGKTLTVTGSKAKTIGVTNPMRYRDYYLDNETGYYYLQSRYYNPEFCRFINADEPSIMLLNIQNEAGINLFAYCNNNPINNVDPTGHISISAIIGGIIGFGVGAIIMPIFADMLKLRGWKRTVFIAGGTAVVTALGSMLGHYAGKALVTLYAKGGTFAQKLNTAIAKMIKKITGLSLKTAKGNGWILQKGKLVVRIMTSSNFRNNYFKISVAGKAAYDIYGKVSVNPAEIHIPITLENIIKLINLIFKLK